jgi:serine/threonine protein kinase
LSDACPNCGRLNRPGARFCASCQTPLDMTVAPLQAGQLLDGGTFRVLRPLGKGGMGAVYLVAQTKAFDRPAVVKEVIDYFDPTDATARRKAAERFEAEARTLGDLRHPGIPDLYAYFSEGGHNYLVMEYIEGQDLRTALTREDTDTGQLLPGSRLPADQVLRYTAQICEVLEYLANRQPPVVHNDIKPGNIIVDSHSGRAVLVDFGTAKTRYLRAAGKPDRKKDSVYGTVGYAAPELYQGRSEPRSDVYSLAATAYHLLTDDDPRDHPAQYPRLDDLPHLLRDALSGALADEIDQRPTAAEFRKQLEGYLAGQTAPFRPLAFPSGDEATSRAEMLALAVKHWDYAAGILLDGTLGHWLRRALRDPAAAQAADEVSARWPSDPDAALDAFIRHLDSGALPQGKMDLQTTSLRLSDIRPGQKLSQTIKIANRGQGTLRGEIFATQPWVRVGGSTFACPPARICAIPIEIDTSGLVAGQPHLAAVTLMPAGGAPEVVSVRIAVAQAGSTPSPGSSGSPAISVTPRRIDFGTVSRQALSSRRERMTVTNVGQTPADCRVVGAPRWLLVKPETFRLMPGARQQVELVARVDKVRGRKDKTVLTLAIDGQQHHEVEVVLRVKGSGLFG